MELSKEFSSSDMETTVEMLASCHSDVRRLADMKLDEDPLISTICSVEDPDQQLKAIRALSEMGGVKELAIDKSSGRNGLMMASALGYKNSVQFLVENANFDIYLGDTSGNTCLMMACENGFEDVVNTLMSHIKCCEGEKGLMKLITCQNKNGETAIEIALKNRRLDCANALARYSHWPSDQLQKTASSAYGNFRMTPVPSSVSMKDTSNQKRFSSLPIEIRKTDSKKKNNIETNLRRMSTTSCSSISTDHSSLPDIHQLVSQYDDSVCEIYSSSALPAIAATNRSGIRNSNVSIHLSALNSPKNESCDEFCVKHAGPVIQNMLNENHNVRNHHKVQRLFRVDSGGSPSTDEASSSPEVCRSPTLMNRVKRLLDRRLQYASTIAARNHYSVDVVAKSGSSSDDVEPIEINSKRMAHNMRPFRSKSTTSSRTKLSDHCGASKTKLPPLKSHINRPGSYV